MVWLTILAVVALWVAGAGIQSLATMNADAVNTIGRLSGLLAAAMLLQLVLLMARLPVFERGLGRDVITRLHRWVGFLSIALLAVHIATLVVGYAMQVGINPLVQAWEFVVDYPGMLLAVIGTGLLLMVAWTSRRAARRKLRYESWHLMHLYAYLGAGLSIPHMLWTGADFMGHPVATALWWTAWCATAVVVLVFRVTIPLISSARLGLRVVSVEPDGPRGVTVRMRGRRPLRAKAGQFFLWRFLDGPGWTRAHPFSLSAAPERGEAVISARIAGDGTQRLTRMRPGTRVMVEGPYGVATGEERRGEGLLLLGAGAGVAPLVSILESEPYAPDQAVLVTREHAPGDGLRTQAIRDLVRTRGLIHYAVDGARGSEGTTWLPATHSGWDGAELLRWFAPEVQRRDVYVCGPTPWMEAVGADLREAGVPKQQIHTEAFSI
jgi:predicted ferric reductase